MKFITKLLFILLILFNKYLGFSLELISENYCNTEDNEDVKAFAQWFSEIYKFMETNRNISDYIKDLNEKIVTLEKNQEILRQQLQEENFKQEIVILRRQDGSENFFRHWEDYKQGFGNKTGEFFIGLENLHKITNTRPYALLIILEDWSKQRTFAKYDIFAIGSEKQQYALKTLGSYSGTAGDSLSAHRGLKFSTVDRENDRHPTEHCAATYRGGWWFNQCHEW